MYIADGPSSKQAADTSHNGGVKPVTGPGIGHEEVPFHLR